MKVLKGDFTKNVDSVIMSNFLHACTLTMKTYRMSSSKMAKGIILVPELYMKDFNYAFLSLFKAGQPVLNIFCMKTRMHMYAIQV